MDVMDQSLDSGSREKNEDSLGRSDDDTEDDHQQAQMVDGTLAIDSTMQYQFRTDGQEGTQVTYRVVQVSQAGGDNDGIMTTATLPPGTQVTQAVIQSPFGSSGGSPRGEGMEARFAYVSTGGGGDGDTATATAVLTNQVAPVGQFYVMMSPQDVLQGQRSIAPRGNQFVTGKGENPRAARDDRRRATHNEVERRRRDKINNWIVTLSKLVPDCAQEHLKQSQVSNPTSSSQLTLQSKGGILSKACDYINDLRSANIRMAESLKEAERITLENELLRQQLEELKQENALLRSQLQQHGILSPDISHHGT